MNSSLAVRNPRTGEYDYTITLTTHTQIQDISKTARAHQVDWLALGFDGRAKALCKLAGHMEIHTDRIQAALEIDTGRRKLAQTEISSVINMLRVWAAMAPTLLPDPKWQTGQAQPHFKHINAYIPYACVGVISPWNFPLILSMIDAIPALMAGACVIIKPSEVTPRFADQLSIMIKDVGLEGILNFAHGDGRTGAALIDVVDCVCFTGSVPTGKKVAIKAAENLIPAHLELGGKDPLIFTHNANIDTATDLALRASVLATGQACQSIERIYVPSQIYDEFTQMLAQKAQAVSLNYPHMDTGDIGPFIFDKQAKIVSAQIKDALDKGASCLSGGEILNHGGGTWLAPTVLRDVTHDMDIMREETFGPVMPVMAYDSIETAIELANDSIYGLSGAVYAGSIAEAQDIGQYLRAGAISLMDAALTGQYFEAGKQSFGQSGLGPSRMGANGFLRFFRQKAYIANTITPLSLADFAE